MGYSAFYYSGSTIAGILTDYLVYYGMLWMVTCEWSMTMLIAGD